MSNSWSKEDRFHFQKSEVFQELEKRVIDTVKRAEILQEKIALDADISQTTQQMNELAEAAKGVAKAKEEAGLALDQSFAEDEVAEDALNEDLQEEVLDDLRGLVEAAIKENNIKLAYRIERTIDEIINQDVACK